MIKITVHSRREKGSIMGMAAISMTAILLAVGLAVDVGHWYLVGGELQNAADAAALAAASSLDSTPGGISQAVDRAVQTVNQYEFSGINATIDRSNVRFATTLAAFDNGAALDETAAKATGVPATIKFVKATVPPKSIGVFFASLATDSATINLSRSAVAGFSAGLNVFYNIAPFSVIEYDTTSTSTQYLDSPDCPNTRQFTRGCTYVIKSDNNISPGNYQLMSFNGDRGGSDLRDKLAIGIDGSVKAGDVITKDTTEPGNKAGPVGQGVNTRFAIYQGGNNSSDYLKYPPDANIKEDIPYAEYKTNITPPPSQYGAGVWGRRVIIVPIVPVSQVDNGRNDITVSKFGAFFLRSSVTGNGQIVAEYIGNDIAFGSGGYDPNAASATGLTVAVLYR